MKGSLLDAVNTGFAALLALAAAWAFPRVERRALLLALVGGALVLQFAAGAFRRSRAPSRWKERVGLVYPVAVLFMLFEALFIIIPALRDVRFDPQLAAFDRALFGVDVTVQLQKWQRPWLTEAMHLLYFSYFPLPLITIGWLYAGSRFEEIEEAYFTLLACYYPCYVVYALVPAAGPGHYLAGAGLAPLEGVLLTGPIRLLIDTLEPSKIDAFPSVHAAILLTTLLVTRRHSKALFWAFVPLAAGIAVALVYTRHHYVVDAIAGFAISGATYAAAGPLYRRWRGRFAPHFGVAS
jgi:membrane-associated phospholipid phosphatase